MLLSTHYKVLSTKALGKLDINIFNYVDMYDNPVNPRLHNDDVIRLKGRRPKKLYCTNYYSFRIVNTWNSIPSEIVSIELSPTGTSTT